RVKPHAFHAVHVVIAEQRVAPASEAEEGHRHRNGDVDAHHANFDRRGELTRKVAGSRKDRGAVRVWMSVDGPSSGFHGWNTHDYEHGPKDLFAIDAHIGPHIVEQRAAHEEARGATGDRDSASVND